MSFVIVQTGLAHIGLGAGIGVYVANLPKNDPRVVLRVQDDIRFVPVAEGGAETEPIYFYGLISGKAYSVQCDVETGGETETKHIFMYAQEPCLEPRGRPIGGCAVKSGIIVSKRSD